MTVTVYCKKYDCRYILHEVVRIESNEKKWVIIRRTGTGFEFPSDYSKRVYQLLKIEE